MSERNVSPEHTKHSKSTGHVLRISGTIIDVQFPRDAVPNIANEVQVMLHTPNKENNSNKASLEVAQQLGDGIVRCIAIENIFGIQRGLEVIDTGAPIQRSSWSASIRTHF